MATSNKVLLGMMIMVIGSPPVSGGAVDDCVAEYSILKEMFLTHSSDAVIECIRTGHSLALFGTGTSPAECEGEGEWHLEAKAIGGAEGECTMRILGSAGAGCEADRVTIPLQANEAPQWRKYLNAECEG